MERNIKLLIAYDGTDFHGWQRQPKMRTVQGEIEDVAKRVLRHPLSMRGSGRTDSGVHAHGQVANLRTTCTIPADNLRMAINARLPTDVCILEAADVHPKFDSILSAQSKLYAYTIFAGDTRPVSILRQRYCYHCWRPMEWERMREASAHFVGEMDYSAMASAGCQRKTMVRTVLRCDVTRCGTEIRIEVEGKGFLYNQVRNMVGTLIDIARGRWPVSRLPEILAGKQRSEAGPTAPAQGLCLEWVRYPQAMLSPPGIERQSESESQIASSTDSNVQSNVQSNMKSGMEPDGASVESA